MDRNKLHVCRNCLAAIEAHEGRQRVLAIDIKLDLDVENQEEITCEWCGDFDPVLYEIG